MVNSTLHVSSLLPYKQKKNAVVVTVKAGSANLKCLKANSVKSCSGARRITIFSLFLLLLPIKIALAIDYRLDG
jgi:hypothetical protein